MTPEEILKELKDLRREIETLKSKPTSQLVFPLDVSSIGVVNNVLATNKMDKIRPAKITMVTGFSDEPSEEGQIVYKSSTKTLKVMLNGALKTITTS